MVYEVATSLDGGEIQGSLHLAQGVCEHSGRYEHVIAWLAARARA